MQNRRAYLSCKIINIVQKHTMGTVICWLSYDVATAAGAAAIANATVVVAAVTAAFAATFELQFSFIIISVQCYSTLECGSGSKIF